LQSAAEERKNESGAIWLKPGDAFWAIARAALTRVNTMNSESRSFTILVTLNVVSLLVIFWLIYFIINNVDTSHSTSNTVARSDSSFDSDAQGRADRRIKKARVTGRAAQIKDINSRVSHAIDKFKKSIEQEVFVDADDNTAAKQALTQIKQSQFDIERSLKTLRQLSREDAEYLQQYKQMQHDSNNITLAEVSPQQARSVTAAPLPAQRKINYYNKVDVSKAREDKIVQQSQSLAFKIQALIAEQKASGTEANSALISKLEKTYIASLKPAAGERKNQSRTIRVRRGDTLWRIAVRAYGSGFDYPRIYAANPHLTSPDVITTGEILRVPL
jgi:nucleoid-associated protein YgaU